MVEQQSDQRNRALAAISNAVVRIHKQFYGRGPRKARAHLSEGVLTVVLEGGLTRGEQTLCEHGHGDVVANTRLAIQKLIEPELRAAIEGKLQRAPRSLMCALDPHQGLEAIVCVLQPSDLDTLDDLPGEGDSRHGSLEIVGAA